MSNPGRTLDILQEDDFQCLNRMVPSPMVVINREGVLFVNEAFEAFTGYSVSDLNRSSFEFALSPPSEALLKHHLASFFEGGLPEYVEDFKLTTAFGDFQWVRPIYKPVLYRDQIHVLLELIDIGETVRVSRYLTKLLQMRTFMMDLTYSMLETPDIEALYQDILSHIISTIEHATLGSILKQEGEYFYPLAHQGFKKGSMDSFKVPAADLFLNLATQGARDRVAKIDDLEIFGTYAKVETEASEEAFIRSTVTAPIYIRDEFFGVINVDSLRCNAFDDDDVQLMEFVRNNVELAIGSHMLLEEKTYLSQHDALTGLYSRGYFGEAFKQILAHAQRYGETFCLVVFDINNLKRINDAHDHMAGDYLLKHFAQVSQSMLRRSDLLARYGGDEFVGLFCETSIEELSERLEAHLAAFKSQPVLFEGKPLRCAYSYGVSRFPEEAQRLETLFKIADRRMYAQKLARRQG